MFCPYCLKNDIQNKLVLIGSECYVCENEWCNYCSSQVNTNDTVDLDKSFEESTTKSVYSDTSLISDISADVNRNEFNVKEKNQNITIDTFPDDIKNKNIGDNTSHNTNNEPSLVISNESILNKLHVYQKKKTKYQKLGIDNNKSTDKVSIVNWLSMPIIKVQSKILCFLLLHLDILEIEKHELLNQIRKEYSIINKLASVFNLELVNSYCYSLMSKIFALSKAISADNIINQQFDKRILNCINNFMMKNDSENLLKCEFSSKLVCKKCQTIIKEKYSDYFISLPFDKSYFNIYRNIISYKRECSKCSALSHIYITVKKLPKILIFHCENGCKERIHRFDVNIQKNREMYPLLCVIESKFSYPGDVVERNIDYQQFLSVNSVSQSINKQPTNSEDDYVIHYKYRNGWYNMSENGPKLCMPSDVINVKNESNVRFLIYGLPTNDNIYDYNASVEDLSINFEMDNRINLSSFVVENHNDKSIEEFIENVEIPVLEESNTTISNQLTESLVPNIRLEKLDLSCFDYDEEKGVYIIDRPVHIFSPSPNNSISRVTSKYSHKHDYNKESSCSEHHQKSISASISLEETQSEEFLSNSSDVSCILSSAVTSDGLNRNNISSNPSTLVPDKSAEESFKKVEIPAVKESNIIISNQLTEPPVPNKNPSIHLDKLNLTCFNYNQEKDVYIIDFPPVTMFSSLPDETDNSPSYSGCSSSEEEDDGIASIHSQSTLSEFDNDDDDDIDQLAYLEHYQKPESISMYLDETLPYEPQNFLSNSFRASSNSSVASDRLNTNQVTLNSSEFSDSSMKSLDLLNRKRKFGNSETYLLEKFISSSQTNKVSVNSITTASDTNDSFSDSSSMKNWDFLNKTRKIGSGESSCCETERFMFSSSGVSSTSSSVITAGIAKRNQVSANSLTTASDISDSCSDSSSLRSWDLLTKKRKIGIDELISMKKAKLT